MRTVIEALVQKQQWQSCRDVAEATLAANPPDSEQAFLWLTLCRCHYKLKEFHKGAQAGVIAQFLARRVGDWDLLGEAIFRTGICYYYARLYELTVTQLDEYFTYQSNYQEARRIQGEVLFTQGAACQANKQYRRASALYQQALYWARENSPDRTAIYRLNLIWMLLELGELDRASQLLQELEDDVAAYPENHRMRLHLAHDRSHLLHLQGHLREAFEQAGHTILEAGKESPLITGQVLLTLHSMARQSGMLAEAVHLALAAKRVAGETGDRPLDERVNEALRELVVEVGTPTLTDVLGQVGQFRSRRPRNKGGRRLALGGAS